MNENETKQQVEEYAKLAKTEVESWPKCRQTTLSCKNNNEEASESALRHDEGKLEFVHMGPEFNVLLTDAIDEGLVKAQYVLSNFFYNQYTEALSRIFMHQTLDEAEDMVKVLMFGAKKYAPLNWRKGMKFSRVLNSARRHLWAMVKGEVVDFESGIAHRGHFWCNVLFMYAYAKLYENTEFDDRKDFK